MPDTEEQGLLDRTILGMMAVELFKRGIDYRHAPWVMRLEHVRLTMIVVRVVTTAAMVTAMQ